MRKLWFLAFLLLQSAPSIASAQDEPVYKGPHLGERVFLSSDLIATYNALGVALFNVLIDRHVYEVDPDYGIEWAYLQTGVGLTICPAYTQASMHVEWQPAAFFQIRADYSLFGYFGTQGGLRGFATGDEPYDVDRDSSLPGTDKASLGHRGLLRPVLAAQFGPVIIRNQLDLALYSVDTDEPYFYELEYDYLLKRTDLLIMNQTQLLFQVWKAPREATLMVGGMYDVSTSMETEIRRQRAGAAIVWQPKDPWGALDRFRVYLVGGWIIEDPNRENEPFLILGVGTDKDFL